MTYEEAVSWLFAAVPNFQRDGGSKNYKIGLEGPMELWSHLEKPGASTPTIHVAGTNGKGSTSHLMAAGLKAMGLRVGLFSSPHLFSFRERAKIGTEMVPESFVAQFVAQNKTHFESKGYSFFELTFAMAMQWFETQEVDWIILETGMGGRLDATNICSPELTLVTNIGLDHVQWLGNNRKAIAGEKAGIFKPGVPAVVVERDTETESVFVAHAAHVGAPLFWATESKYPTDLKGSYQRYNVSGATTALRLLFPEYEPLWSLGFEHVSEHTGLRGRWEQFGSEPKRICDTGHNGEAFHYIVPQALCECSGTVHWILGAANDKDLQAFFSHLPKERSAYYWTGCSSPRCHSGETLRAEALNSGIEGTAFARVQEALDSALEQAQNNDLIFVGGSTFVVADLNLIS